MGGFYAEGVAGPRIRAIARGRLSRAGVGLATEVAQGRRGRDGAVAESGGLREDTRMRWNVLGAIALAFAACGESPRPRAPWFTRAVGETSTVGAFSVVSVDGVTEIEESELSALVARARAANGNAEVRTLEWTRMVALGGPMVIVKFVPHRVTARVRFHRVMAFIKWKGEGDERPRWQQEERVELHAEVCPPGRSFLVDPEIAANRVLDIVLHSDVGPEVLMEILDDVAADLPAGEVPMSIGAEKEGYEMYTVDAKAIRRDSGTVFRVVRQGGRWHASWTGHWIN